VSREVQETLGGAVAHDNALVVDQKVLFGDHSVFSDRWQ
jgi:hypothetical protein